MKFTKFIFLVPLITSCATIVNGSRQAIGFSTNPTNAEIWVDNRFVGRSPLIVEMKRCDNHFVRIQLDGYMPYELTLTKELSGWVAGNFFFGGFVGVAVDAITGGLYKLTPEQVQAVMYKSDDIASHESDGASIFVVLEADPSWEKIDNLIASR